MDNSSIFTITAVSQIDFSNLSCHLGDKQCVGWFPTFQEAETAILNNTFGANKNLRAHNNWFIIEEMNPGCYKDALSRYWYCWDKQNKKYRNISALTYFAIHSNIGIG